VREKRKKRGKKKVTGELTQAQRKPDRNETKKKRPGKKREPKRPEKRGIGLAAAKQGRASSRKKSGGKPKGDRGEPWAPKNLTKKCRATEKKK